MIQNIPVPHSAAFFVSLSEIDWPESGAVIIMGMINTQLFTRHTLVVGATGSDVANKDGKC